MEMEMTMENGMGIGVSVELGTGMEDDHAAAPAALAASNDHFVQIVVPSNQINYLNDDFGS